MLAAIVTVAHRGARGVAQAAGTIHPDARPEYTAGDTKIHGGTMRALLTRGLIVGTVRHADVWSAWETTDYQLTSAGYDALAIAHGVQVRPEWDTPDLHAVLLTQDDTDALTVVGDAEISTPAAHGIDNAAMVRLYRRGLIHMCCGVFRLTPDGQSVLDAIVHARQDDDPAPAVPGTLTEDQMAGMACTVCAVDYRTVSVPSVPAGYGPRGQVFRCLGCSDASDAHGDEVDAPGEEPDSESEPVLGGGDGSIVDGWPADSGDLLRMAVTDILDGFTPMTCEPLRTATVPRASGGDGAYAPTAHPNDLDGGSPLWRSLPRVRLR